MNLVDIIIILVIICGAIVGFKRGVVKQAVMTIGMILVVVLSFLLKNPLSVFLYQRLPFLSFGILEDYTVFNILVYEFISFLIIYCLLSIVLFLLIKASSIIEKFFKATVILAIPSKILGLILGAIEYYVIVFIVLFILSGPIFFSEKFHQIKPVSESKIGGYMLKHTPILSHFTKKTLKSIDELVTLYKTKDNYSVKDFNCKAIKIMKKDKIVSEESIEYLESHGKIKRCD
ncbi:MAG: CvpA family protein [Bacilli bacterium]|nr:CvpA family protein [Bacilli bacterium]